MPFACFYNRIEQKKNIVIFSKFSILHEWRKQQKSTNVDSKRFLNRKKNIQTCQTI